MAFNGYTAFLRAEVDGTVTANIRKFEDFIGGAAKRVAQTVDAAGRAADGAFNFAGARRAIGDLQSELKRVGSLNVQRTTDPFGIAASLAGLKNSPFQKFLAEQQAGESALAAQRARAHQQHMAEIEQEVGTAIAGIRTKQAAQAAAFAQAQTENDRLLALDRQRAEEQLRAVSGRTFIQAPSFDPTGIAASATAARAHAVALDALALAAERVANAEQGATATDRAYAATLRESAGAAGQEATRLDELAATQRRVAGAASNLAKESLNLGTSQRNTRFATLQASQQFQDFFIQIQGGQNPLVAFSQQASQLAFVMSQTGGTVGKFAAFMSGGWGTALFAGISVLTLLTAGLFNSEKQAKKTAGAIDIHKASLEELIKAIDDENEALGRAVRSSSDAEQASLNAAAAKQQEILKRRENIIAILQEERASLQQAQSQTFGAAGGAGAGAAISVYAGRVQQLESQLAAATAALTTAQRNVSLATVPIAQRRVSEALDPSKRAQGDYDRAVSAATAAYVESTKTLGLTNTDQKARREAQRVYQQAVAAATVQQEKTNAAIRERERAERDATGAAKKAATYSSFQLPVKGAIASGFGSREAPKAGASTFHKGVDFAVPTGTNVRAPQVGTVEAVGFDPKLGKFVILNHGAGTTTRYGHLSTIDVTKGQQVEQGQVIAQSGATGNVTGAHLHYEVRQGGKAVNPLAGRFATDEFKVAEAGSRASEQAAKAAERAAAKAQRQQEQLIAFGTEAANRIAGVNAQFDEQPRLIDQASAAVRDLDRLIAKLAKEKPPGFEGLIDQAEAARAAAVEAPNRALREYLKLAGQQQQIDQLILAGREDEAAALQDIVQLQERGKVLSEAEKQAVLGTVQAQRQRAREVQEYNRQIQGTVRLAETIQDSFTGILRNPFSASSYKDAGKAILGQIQQNFAETISHKLLGNLGLDVENALRNKSDPLFKAGDHLTTSADDISSSADDLSKAAADLSSAASAQSRGPTAGQLTTTPTAFLGASGSSGGALGALASIFGASGGRTPVTQDPNGDIVVTARRRDPLAQGAGSIGSLESFGIGAINSLIGGVGGNAGIKGGKISDLLGSIAQQIGQAVPLFGLGLAVTSGLSKILGVKNFAGGAFGIVGNLIAKALGFGKKQSGFYTVNTDAGGQAVARADGGNNSTAQQNALALAQGVTQQLNQIATALHGRLSPNAQFGSIGQVDNKFTFDPTPGNSAGRLEFATEQEAVTAAIKYALDKGVVQGIRASTQRLLRAGTDFQAALDKAVKFENVFTDLKKYTDPVGAALDELDAKFNDLINLFNEAGASAAEYTDLERLYSYQRADAIKSATQAVDSTLKAFLADLTYSGDNGLSLRTRETAALSAFNPYRTQIQAGQSVDAQGFTEASRALLDIERQIYGSTRGYFDTLDTVTGLTRNAISIQDLSVQPLADTMVTQTSLITTRLDAVIAQLTLANTIATAPTTITPGSMTPTALYPDYLGYGGGGLRDSDLSTRLF